MSFNPRTDKPAYLRPNSFRGNAFEMAGMSSGAKLRDLNGNISPLGIIGSSPLIEPSICSNSEPNLGAAFRNTFAYYLASSSCAATRESGTMWVAFKRTGAPTFYSEWFGDFAVSRYVYCAAAGTNIIFAVNGAGASSFVSLGAIDSLNVLGYSWDADGFYGYLNGDLIWSSATAPTGSGDLTGLSVGTWQGSTTYTDNADYYSTRILPYALSAAEHKAWADDIWLPYRDDEIILKAPVITSSTTILPFLMQY